jgi:hypothetical protein
MFSIPNAGLVPASAQNTSNPLDCGEISTFLSVDLAEAIVHAVNRVNTDQSYKVIYIRRNIFGECVCTFVVVVVDDDNE